MLKVKTSSSELYVVRLDAESRQASRTMLLDQYRKKTMIRTTLTFRMPTLRLVGTLLILAALAGLPTSAWAEFRIGVWQPGGHTLADTLFTRDTADDLDALGVDLLINTPNGVGNDATRTYQAFEESILSQWSGTGRNGPRGFVVQHAPEGAAAGYHWKLDRYAGSLWVNCRQGAFAGDRNNTDLTSGQRINLGETVDSLATKWTTYDGFYGYRIGHEHDPCGRYQIPGTNPPRFIDGGIYNSVTYDNMVTVIDSIRAYDTEHRIIAVGNTWDTRWTSAEQTAFGQRFFRPDTTATGDPDPSPANIFMQEVYILRHGDSDEDDVQDRFDLLRTGLDAIGTMVRTARDSSRKAEWHFIANVGDQWQTTSGSTTPCNQHYLRDPTVAELNAQVNMALSRGATGITYFLYTSSAPNSCDDDDYRYEGLVEYRDRSNHNQRNRRTVWNTVRTVNNTLRTLGDALYPLTWDAGFPSNSLSNATLVDMVRHATAGRLEFGVFHDDDADYVLVVNRHNLTITPRRSQTIDLRFDTQQMQSNHATGGHYIVREIITNAENTHAADASNHIWVTGQTLAPGDARLYRIERMEVPSAPQNLTVVKVGDGTVTLRWDNPDNATIDNWQYQQNGGDDWQGMSGANTYVYDYITDTYEYTVRGLTNETTYTFEVRAHNAAGWGLASASVTATPRLFTLTAMARNESVLLDWTPAPSRGASIDRYAYRYSSDGGDTWTDTSSAWVRDLQANSDLSYTVMELTNDELYTFEMYAYDSAGEVAVASASATPGTETAAVQVAYGSDSYQAQEGGEAVEVTVRLTGPARKAVSIPVTVTRDAGTEVGDYAVGWKGHPANSLSFAVGDRSQSFEITANEDADSADETVTVGLTLDGDDLPSWLGAGTPTTATARLLDDDGNRTVSFSSVMYQATEGGAAVEVSVRLSPAPWQTVSIPVQVMGTEAGDYTVPNLAADGTVSLSFAAGVSSRSFGITANEDTDNADETVSLTFGTLPAGVVAVGTTQQATVRLLDNDGVVSLSSQSPRVGTQLTAELTDRSGGITSTTWQWQRRSSPTDSWINAAGTSSQPQPSISIYTPQVGDLGDQLRATVEYDDAGGTDQTAASAPTDAVQAPPETQYAYRASQTAPLPFDTDASGTPNNWSSSEITWTDAAPRVWRIERTRPSGGHWSKWGGLEKYSERPVAQPDPFYRQAASQPDPPGNMISSATPTDWLTSNPGATATQGVWRTERTRPAGATHYRFSTPTQITPPLETESAYRLHTSGTTAPTFTASASTVPTGWFSSRQTPTSSNRYEWQISRTRPTGGSWSHWGRITVVSTYTERQYAYRVGISGSTAPSFSASSSGIPTGWSSSRRTPGPSVPYEWQISRMRPTGGSWSSWSRATVVAKYTETQSAYRISASGSTTPSFSASSSGIPTGWSSSRRTPGPSVPYVWRITRTRPAGESWSSWGSASVVSRYTERQAAYKRNNSGTSAPAFSSTANGTPYGWSSSPPSPTSSNRYVWKISRSRPAGGSWSNWGSASVVSRYTERQTAFRLHTSGTSAPSFSASASGVPTGWSSSRRTTNPHERYEWRISRTKPTGGSWSSWGSASVVSRYTERQTAYRLHTSGTSAPSFSASASGVPSGWSSSRRTTNPHERYEWRISRSRPTGGSWSNWGSATVVSTYTARQTTYRWNNSDPTFLAATIGADAESLTSKVKRRLVIAPGGPASLAAASGFGTGPMAVRLGIPARRPKNPS